MFKGLVFGFLLLLASTCLVKAQPGFDGNLNRQFVVNGDNKMKLGDFNGAILEYSTAVNSNVAYGEALIKRAIALNLVGRAAEARADLDKAFRLSQDYKVMYDTLTTKGMRRDSLATVSNPYLNLDVGALPKDTATFKNNAVGQLELGDYIEANKYLTGYLIKNPNDTAALLFTAIAHVNQAHYDSATVYLNRINPTGKSALAFNVQGLSFYKQGMYLEAIERYNKAIALNPGFSIAYFNRAMCKKRLGNERGYMKDFEKAIDTDAQIANTFYNRSYHGKRTGDFTNSVDDYNNACANDNCFVNDYFQTASSKKLLTDYFNLLDEFQKNADKDATDAEGFFNKANFEMLFGEYTSSVNDYNKAVNLNPQNAVYLFNRGMARIMKNETTSGCRDIKKSADLGVNKANLILEKFCK